MDRTVKQSFKKMTKILLKTLLILLISSPLSGQTDFYEQLADSAFVLTKQNVKYDPSCFQLDYPNGDVPVDKGT